PISRPRTRACRSACTGPESAWTEARGPTQVPARGPAVSTRGPSGSVPLVTTPIAARETDDSRRYRPEPSVLSALSSPRLLTREVLAGLVVGLALIPEAIAFSSIAGGADRARDRDRRNT